MSDDLVEFLTAESVDPATLQHAVRYLVDELSGDETRATMRDRIVRAAGDATVVDDALLQVSTHSDLLLEADLAIVAQLWAEPDTRELVKSSVADAKDRLPVVETAVIAFAAVYGLYLLTTRGRKRWVKKIVRKADGSWTESEEVDYSDPTGPLRELGKLLGRFAP